MFAQLVGSSAKNCIPVPNLEFQTKLRKLKSNQSRESIWLHTSTKALDFPASRAIPVNLALR